MTYKLTPKAELDLDDIWKYSTKKWGVQKAMDYTDELVAGFQFLNKHPTLNQPRTEFSHPICIHRCNKHLIIYLEKNRDILIVRILHERMDIESHITQ